MASSMNEFEHLVIQLEEIKSATNNFNEDNVIGRGGFGKVYKGELSHSHSKGKSMVALKRLDRRHGQGDAEFYKEVRMLSCYRHENIISLLGFSHGRDEMILVYEYASRGSLDGYLKDVNLTWTQRLKICLDAAKGLSYLHDPRETYQRLIHCDIKSANILLDENFKAKVSDFGLSKIGPANQQNSILVTGALGTFGYCDPLFMETYSLTKESDVYSFGVVLLEVLSGNLCFEFSNGQLKILVPMWKQCYEQKQLSGIVFQGLTGQMNLDSLETFADIAYKCLKRSREERPTMSLVVEKLQESLALQELHDIKPPKEYEEIVNAAVPPLNYRSLDELKVLLTEGFHVNEGKTWFSISEKGEHYGMISIQDCLIQDDPSRDYSDQYSFEINSRFEVGCYKTHLMEFKLSVKIPLFLSPGVTYGLNLVFHYSEREKMKQQLVGVRYQLQGETKFSILRFADKREDKQLVAELYQFTSNEEGIQDLEILLEDCGLLGHFYIEGIEFQPLERVEHPVVVTNEDIVRAAVPPLFYGFTEISEVLLSQGVFLNKGRTWLSINDKGELCVLISIEECLIQDDPNTSYSDNFLLQKDSRFAICCYKADKMNFKLRVRTPLFLSPDVTYGLNLVFHYSHTERENMKLQHVGVRYKFQGETKVSVLHFDDKKEDKRLVTGLYQFNSTEECISDFEILLEDCGFSSDFYIEGIEFQPLKNVCCLNDKGQRIERIFIEACLDPDEASSVKHLDNRVNSRFPGGRCYIHKDKFKAHVRAEYLTPHISYTLNLIFEYEYEHQVNSYNPLRYKIDVEDDTKVFIIYPSVHMREDGWFVIPLYHFTTQHTTAELQFEFEERWANLLVAGIEFQPSEEKVQLPVFEEYQDIVEVASQPLFYTSLDELNQILSTGIHLNSYKTWFSINEKGEHCHLISMKDCLIPNEGFPSEFKSNRWSRFPAGLYQTNNKGFKTHVKTQLLSPSITYTVNLVFNSYSSGKTLYVDLKYTLRGEATTSVVYLAIQRDDDPCYMAELYQFTSDGSIVDLEITFDNHGSNLQVEGILFQPLEIVEDHPESDPESDPAQKLLDDYEEVLNLSKESLMWTSKKELYSILRSGFLINNGQQWFTVDKHGKKCPMLSASATWVIDDKNSACKSSHESRFGEVLVITAGDKFELVIEIKPRVLSADTLYASYFVYKLPQDQSTFEYPLKVNTKNKRWQVWFVYLVSPPGTPVIGPKFDENKYNPLNRHKLSALPRQRSDGWMEVKVWKFKTLETPKTASMHLKLEHPVKNGLSGLIIHGIELRPI